MILPFAAAFFTATTQKSGEILFYFFSSNQNERQHLQHPRQLRRPKSCGENRLWFFFFLFLLRRRGGQANLGRNSFGRLFVRRCALRREAQKEEPRESRLTAICRVFFLFFLRPCPESCHNKSNGTVFSTRFFYLKADVSVQFGQCSFGGFFLVHSAIISLHHSLHCSRLSRSYTEPVKWHSRATCAGVGDPLAEGIAVSELFLSVRDQWVIEIKSAQRQFVQPD